MYGMFGRVVLRMSLLSNLINLFFYQLTLKESWHDATVMYICVVILALAFVVTMNMKTTQNLPGCLAGSKYVIFQVGSGLISLQPP